MQVAHLHGGHVVAVHGELEGDHGGRRAAVDQALVQHVVHALQLPLPASEPHAAQHYVSPHGNSFTV